MNQKPEQSLIDPALQATGDGIVDHNGYVRIRKNQTGGSKPDIHQIPQLPTVLGLGFLLTQTAPEPSIHP
jgi:hypothetical protein